MTVKRILTEKNLEGMGLIREYLKRNADFAPVADDFINDVKDLVESCDVGEVDPQGLIEKYREDIVVTGLGLLVTQGLMSWQVDQNDQGEQFVRFFVD